MHLEVRALDKGEREEYGEVISPAVLAVEQHQITMVPVICREVQVEVTAEEAA